VGNWKTVTIAKNHVHHVRNRNIMKSVKFINFLYINENSIENILFNKLQ
jgi:hypothetical protein